MTDPDDPYADFLEPEASEAFVVTVDGFEGPLDLLLQLARTQKVDLAAISLLALVEQYLSFIAAARRLKLELAADYLVMAAWLAWLKSRLLLPKDDGPTTEPSAQDLAARLQLQLRRLEAIREAGTRLVGRRRLGRDVFMRGAPEALQITRHRSFDATLYQLLKAYGDVAARRKAVHYTPHRRPVMGLEAAIARLERLIGVALDWTELGMFLPVGPDLNFQRSVLASTFLASLEMARSGRAELQQGQAFGPLYLRARTDTM